MADDDDSGYGQAKGNFIITPRRTSALDNEPYDVESGAAAGFIIKPEPEDEAPAPPPQPSSITRKLLGQLDDDTADKPVRPAPITHGGVRRNAKTGEIAEFIGEMPTAELQERRQSSIDHYVDTVEEAWVLEIVPLTVYREMNRWCDWRWERGLSTYYRECYLRVSEFLQAQAAAGR